MEIAKDIIIAVITSWPLVVGIIAIVLRRPLGQLISAIAEKLDRSTSVRLPGGVELNETVVELAEDTLEIKKKILQIDAKPEQANLDSSTAETASGLINELVNAYDTKTSVSDYAERMRLKTDIQNKMESVARKLTVPVSHFIDRGTEGAYLAAVCACVTLPYPEAISVLFRVGPKTNHLFVRNALMFRLVELFNQGGEAEFGDLNQAIILLHSYAEDKAHPPDPTFRRNLKYYRQIVRRAIYAYHHG